MINELKKAINDGVLDSMIGEINHDNLVINENPDKSSLRFDLMNSKYLGRFSLWDSGEVEVELLDVEDISTVYSNQTVITNVDQVFDVIKLLVEKMK